MTFWIIQWKPSLDSWSISSQRSCMPEIKKSYQTAFEKIGKKLQKQPNLTFFKPFGPWKSFWENCLQVKKEPNFDLSDLSKWHLGWFNQIHIFTMHWYHPKEATCQKRKKVIRQFLRNQAFNWKVDDGRTTDGRRTTDDGRIGIRKAPLPFGWRS